MPKVLGEKVAKTTKGRNMNVNEMKLGFEMKTKELPLEAILPIRKNKKAPTTCGGIRRIVKSIREVGMVEPLVVHSSKGQSQARFCCWTGHLRLFALKQLGETVAECIISNDDECFTYKRADQPPARPFNVTR